MVRLDRRSSEGMRRGICRVGKLIFSPFKFMAKGHGEAFHCHVLCELWSGFGFPVWWPFRDLLTRDSRLKAGEQRAEFVLMKRLTDVWGVATSLYVVPTRMSVSGRMGELKKLWAAWVLGTSSNNFKVLHVSPKQHWSFPNIPRRTHMSNDSGVYPIKPLERPKKRQISACLEMTLTIFRNLWTFSNISRVLQISPSAFRHLKTADKLAKSCVR